MSLADQLSYRPITKKEKKWKIHLGGRRKGKDKGTSERDDDDVEFCFVYRGSHSIKTRSL